MTAIIVEVRRKRNTHGRIVEAVSNPTAANTQNTNAQRKPRNTDTGQGAGQRENMTGGQGHAVTTESRGQTTDEGQGLEVDRGHIVEGHTADHATEGRTAEKGQM